MFRQDLFRWRSLVSALLPLAFLAGCAAYGGRGLQPGQSSLADVLAVMGRPAMEWENPDGSRQLSYPRGPAGVHSFMVHVGPDQLLRRIDNVMDTRAFARIREGQTQEEVLRVLGPPEPAWTTYYPARRELVWEWRYCDDWHAASRFDVLFDKDSGRVRSTLSWRETCYREYCFCSR